jgi:hypothetical protein
MAIDPKTVRVGTRVRFRDSWWSRPDGKDTRGTDAAVAAFVRGVGGQQRALVRHDDGVTSEGDVSYLRDHADLISDPPASVPQEGDGRVEKGRFPPQNGDVWRGAGGLLTFDGTQDANGEWRCVYEDTGRPSERAATFFSTGVGVFVRYGASTPESPSAGKGEHVHRWEKPPKFFVCIRCQEPAIIGCLPCGDGRCAAHADTVAKPVACCDVNAAGYACGCSAWKKPSDRLPALGSAPCPCGGYGRDRLVVHLNGCEWLAARKGKEHRNENPANALKLDCCRGTRVCKRHIGLSKEPYTGRMDWENLPDA